MKAFFWTCELSEHINVAAIVLRIVHAGQNKIAKFKGRVSFQQYRNIKPTI